MLNAGELGELNQAFQTFASLSGSLQRSYVELENKVTVLNTELSRAHATQEKLDRRFERLLEALAGGVLLVGADDVVDGCNPAAVELLGEPLLEQSWEAIRRRAFTNGSLYGGEFALASGRHVTISCRPLGEDCHVILITDVTESHLVRELAARSQRLATMGEMAARLAHQLRTPLAAALLYASQLGAALPMEARGRELFELVGTETLSACVPASAARRETSRSWTSSNDPRKSNPRPAIKACLKRRLMARVISV